MNRIVLISAIAALLVFGGLLATRNCETVPYYVPHATHTHTSPLTSPESIFIDSPKVDQIKMDLSGKTIVIGGVAHTFVGPELNYMNILTVKQSADGVGEVVDVQICADATIVNKSGFLGMRKSYTHENVFGSLRVYYDKKDRQWVYRMAENIDLQKTLVPNAVAPPSDTQVFRNRK